MSQDPSKNLIESIWRHFDWFSAQTEPWRPISDPKLLKIVFGRGERPLWEHATAATEALGAMGAGEVVSRTVSRSPPYTSAGGQDDGSHTNSRELIDKTGWGQ